MEAQYSAYDFSASRNRIDEILDARDASFEELDSIPSRDKLTFTNGFYVNCTALFVDIRGSSELGKVHRRPTLAKLYRAYISELIAVLKSTPKCREVSIHGDAVWGVYSTPYKPDIDIVFGIAAMAQSLINTLNHKLKKRGITQIKTGIGIDYGRALMVKAGYKGSGINDVIWMGEVVNLACHLAGYGNKLYSDEPMMVSDTIWQNLREENRALLKWNYNRQCYHGNVINVTMNEWIDSQSQSV